MKFQLVARITSNELLRKSINERGLAFYQTDDKGNVCRVVYFSGSRVVEFIGSIDEDMAKYLKVNDFRVNSIEVDELQGFVRIQEGETA
jgi:hypothetical protein